MHRQQFAAALVVVVGEHRAADARQRGVASEEVSGKRSTKSSRWPKVSRSTCIGVWSVFTQMPCWSK